VAAPGPDSSRSPLFLFGALCVLVAVVVGGWLFVQRTLRAMPLEAVAAHEAAAVVTLRAIHAAGGNHPEADSTLVLKKHGYRFEVLKGTGASGWCAYAWPDGGPTLPEGRTFYVDPAGKVLAAPPPAGAARTAHPGNPAADGRTWTAVE